MPKRMKLKDAPAKVDPTRPFTAITIDGKTYKMCFDYASLALGEAILNAKGFEVNILGPMLKRNFNTVRTLFAVSLAAYQPELDPEITQDWVSHGNLSDILLAIEKAWAKSMPEPEKADPPPPAQ